ncbi:hypothetical protein FA95DRAFT_1566185 [Auriscalpium vulgare]|uniref:Uncharacterized protein n=1 Tax=Auriscalpium vulgare TaxID=40419 RepID=A0ACB8R9L6_9AGAM|nr:hypothetical protein FA95DRAFT_1566185 [Auriscalpium vulgare]
MSTSNSSIKDLAQSAAHFNKEHQYSLKVYAERLEAELRLVDKFLAVAEVEEDESTLEVAGFIEVPGVEKAVGLLSGSDPTSESSPFCTDSLRRQRYMGFTEVRPMKPKELESLAEGVRVENHRMRAQDAQQRGYPFLGNQQSAARDLHNTEGIDWERIAAKVNADSAASIGRTATECEIRWLGDRHPQFNHSQWTAPEVEKARTLVESLQEGEINWVHVAQELGTNRVPLDVMRHAIPRQTHVWDTESDSRLLEAVAMYGMENWQLVARTVGEHATAASCQKRFQRSLDPALKRGNWTTEEDDVLRIAVGLYGHAWIDIATFIPGRTNEQCRDRWSERLNPSVAKGKWSKEEDALLLSAVDALGVGQWKEISEQVGTGRTDNMCRYRYETLKKQEEAASSAESNDQDRTIPPRRRRSRTSAKQATGPASGVLVQPSQGIYEKNTAGTGRSRPRPRARKVATESHETTDEVTLTGPANDVQSATEQSKKQRPKARRVRKESVHQVLPVAVDTTVLNPVSAPSTARSQTVATHTAMPERERFSEEEDSEAETDKPVRKVRRGRKLKAHKTPAASPHTSVPQKRKKAATSTAPQKRKRTSTNSEARDDSDDGAAGGHITAELSHPNAHAKTRPPHRTVVTPRRRQPARAARSRQEQSD